MKKTYTRWLALLAFILTLVFAEWTLQMIAFNAACKFGDAACVQGTSDWITIRASLTLVSFVAMLAFAYSALRKSKDKT